MNNDFFIERHTIGRFQEYVLCHKPTESKVCILPRYGAMVRLLQLDNYKVIDAGADAILTSTFYESAILAPFGGRIENNFFSFQEKHYTFPAKDNNPHALHGFVHSEEFKILHTNIFDNFAEILLHYSYDGSKAYYPFPFDLTVNYRLQKQPSLAPMALNIVYTATNTGKQIMPFGLGWHPYFSFENEVIDDWLLSLPTSTMVVLNDNMMPIATQELENGKEFLLSGIRLDNPFVIECPPSEGSVTKLYSSKSKQTLSIWQDSSAKHLVIFTHPNRKSIAIEPMTHGINALNTNENIWLIHPKKQQKLHLSVTLHV